MESYIKQGNCLELMKEIPNKSVDMVLCDLPYGTTCNKWDSVIQLDLLWEQYKRIIKDNGAIVLTAQVPFNIVLGYSNLDMLRYEWIWEKNNTTGFLNAKKMPLKKHENILVFYKELPTYNPQMERTENIVNGGVRFGNSSNYGKQTPYEQNNNGETYPRDVLKFGYDKEKLHPTQKPVALFEYLIKTYTNENEVVLDNCMGSGTTCVACINTNRKYIGFELNEEYYNISEKRIEKTKLLKEKPYLTESKIETTITGQITLDNFLK